MSTWMERKRRSGNLHSDAAMPHLLGDPPGDCATRWRRQCLADSAIRSQLIVRTAEDDVFAGIEVEQISLA
jgi:hypothetical protein